MTNASVTPLDNVKQLIRAAEEYKALLRRIKELEEQLINGLEQGQEVIGIKKVVSLRKYFSSADRKWLEELDIDKRRWSKNEVDLKKMAKLLENHDQVIEHFADGHHIKEAVALKLLG